MARYKMPINAPAPMEDRDSTDEEILAVLGTSVEVPPITAPMDPERFADPEPAPAPAATVPTVDLARIASVMESLQSRVEVAGGQDSKIADALTALAQALVTQSQVQASATIQGAQIQATEQRRNTRPENAFAPGISAFNVRGDRNHPRPALKCRILLPWEANDDVCTREEIELLNLLEPGEWTIRRADRSPLTLVVKATYKANSTTLDTLVVFHDTGFNNDNKGLMPHDWMRQMVSANPAVRAAAANVLTMDEERELIAQGLMNTKQPPVGDELLVSMGG